MKTEYIIGALVLLYLLKKPKTPIQTAATDEFSVPTWGANWISNQWAMVQQGTLAHTGQIKAGGYV